MKTLAFAILVAGAIVLGIAASGNAMQSHGFSGGRPGGHFGGFHRFDGFRRFDDRHVFVHDRVRIFVAPFFFGSFFVPAPIVSSSAVVYAPPVYWYYCRSYGAYYPSVPSCPEPWVPVPAQ
jgi:hypothetical protein